MFGGLPFQRRVPDGPEPTPQADDDDIARDDDDSATDDDDCTADDDDSGPDDDDATPPPIVQFVEADVAAEQSCPPESRDSNGICFSDSTSWIEPYDAFFSQPESMAAAVPVPECDAWLDELAAIREAQTPWVEMLDWDDVTPEQLGDEIWRGVGMEFLHDGLWERPLTVLMGEPTSRVSPDGVPYVERQVILRDRFAGDVPALLLLPEGAGPHPAVVALPGHAENGASHVNWRFGSRFPEAGFGLLAVSFRAYQQTGDGGPIRPESEVARLFLCNGFNLMAMRAYETLLAVRALDALEVVDGGRIGAIGHSGGSVTSTFLLWRDDVPIDAWVLDNPPAFFDVEVGGDWGYTVDCGVHPELQKRSSLIGDRCALPPEWGREVLRVPYAYSVPIEADTGACDVWPTSDQAEEPSPDDPDGCSRACLLFCVTALSSGQRLLGLRFKSRSMAHSGLRH
jgi:hypothetical protein